MLKICLLQLLKCEDLTLFCAMHVCKLNYFGLLIRQKKIFEDLTMGSNRHFTIF